MSVKQTILREEYISRINRVLDYIEQNIDQELSLKELATVANFSPFHFHRIFRALVGETLNQFIQRLRIEKAAKMLIDAPRKSITEIALDCGFSSSATFARSFKEAYLMNASQWRQYYASPKSKNCKTNRNESKAFPSNSSYDFRVSIKPFSYESPNQTRRSPMIDKNCINIEVKELPELNVAYARHIGPPNPDGDGEVVSALFEKVVKWAEPRDLLKDPSTQFLAVFHDDPEFTESDKIRTSACITVPSNTAVDGEIGQMTIPGGKFVVARFEIQSHEFEEAWDFLMGNWLPESGYQPDDRLCYELYHNDFQEHPEKKHIVDICEPVRPL